jgi:hypothetical protein
MTYRVCVSKDMSHYLCFFFSSHDPLLTCFHGYDPLLRHSVEMSSVFPLMSDKIKTAINAGGKNDTASVQRCQRFRLHTTRCGAFSIARFRYEECKTVPVCCLET